MHEVPVAGSVANAPAQECRNVPRPLRHCEDLNRSAFSKINHEVSSHRPKQNGVGSKIFAPVAHARGLPECFERIEQFVDPVICRRDIVRSDVLPDIRPNTAAT